MEDDQRWLEKLIKSVEDVIEVHRQNDPHRHRHLIENLEQLRRRLEAKLRDAS